MSGRTIALPPVLVVAFQNVEVFTLFFYVISKALTGKLSCPVTGLVVYVPTKAIYSQGFRQVEIYRECPWCIFLMFNYCICCDLPSLEPLN